MTVRILTASQRGFSLIELIIAIMIIGASVVGVLSMMNFLAARSADPMIQEQAMLIGEAYLDEILLKPFLDPSAGTANVCPVREAGGRSNYDNVCDYNDLYKNEQTQVTDAGVHDQFGNPIDGLAAYTVTVTVTGDNTVTLGPAGSQINNSGVLRVLRVDVRVQDRLGTMAIMLTGYRTNYNCNATGDAACRPL